MSILKEKQLLINERIRAKEVRLIGVDGQLGIVSIEEALKYASNVGLDLIEVSPQANPPVCKVMDYGKYKYEQGKRERDAAKKQKQVEIKTIRMRPATDDHDFNFKTNNAIKFLKSGNKVRVQVMFKSREITHPEIAHKNLDKLAEKIANEGCGKVEKGPIIEGKSMSMLLAPIEN